MNRPEIAAAVQQIIMDHFKVSSKKFSWNDPLEMLNSDFRILGHLVYLEKLLAQHFGKPIHLIENIGAAHCTASDIVDIIVD
ncbi:hypothetical protein [Flavilitoribacter nigricans]|nr:hypothetical protein [Flavilitoribacter nigricans]